eukprot:353299-Chlamydomonas_euryale.AAC.16
MQAVLYGSLLQLAACTWVPYAAEHALPPGLHPLAGAHHVRFLSQLKPTQQLRHAVLDSHFKGVDITRHEMAFVYPAKRIELLLRQMSLARLAWMSFVHHHSSAQQQQQHSPSSKHAHEIATACQSRTWVKTSLQLCMDLACKYCDFYTRSGSLPGDQNIGRVSWQSENNSSCKA